MRTIQDVYNFFPKSFFDTEICAIHHYGPTGFLIESEYYNDKKIKLHDELIVIQVNDQYHRTASRISKIPFENKSQIIEIIEEPYFKWVSKIKALYEYIKKNYNNLPQYFIYTDAHDVLIIKDILNPKEILDFYKCDMLFNAEPNFMSTGFSIPSSGFYNPLFLEPKEKYIKLNEIKYGIKHDRSINAGFFLCKKDFGLFILEKALYYMTENQEKGFPYGCLDDQYMFRYLHVDYYDNIACDIYNKYFLFAYPKCLDVEETNPEHYQSFKNNHINLYLK